MHPFSPKSLSSPWEKRSAVDPTPRHLSVLTAVGRDHRRQPITSAQPPRASRWPVPLRPAWDRDCPGRRHRRPRGDPRHRLARPNRWAARRGCGRRPSVAPPWFATAERAGSPAAVATERTCTTSTSGPRAGQPTSTTAFRSAPAITPPCTPAIRPSASQRSAHLPPPRRLPHRLHHPVPGRRTDDHLVPLDLEVRRTPG